MDYEIVRYTPELLPQIAALRHQEWGEDTAQTEAYLTWKYVENPYSERVCFYVALAGDEVIGMRGMYGGLLSGPGGTVQPTAAGGDSLVAPQHRGQRISNQITRFALDDLADGGCDFALSLSANRTSTLLSLRSGWVRVCPFQSLHWGTVRGEAPGPRRRGGQTARTAVPHRAARAALRHLRRAKRAVIGGPMAPFQRLQDRLDHTATGRRIFLEPSPRPEPMAELVRRQEQAEARIRLVRDEAFYAWRFNDPRSVYRFLFAEDGDGALDCFIVLQQLRQGGDVAIAGWQFNDEGRWLDLLRAVLESGAIAGLRIWSATLPSSLLQGLERLGFQASPQPDTRAYPAYGLLVTATRAGVPAEEWLVDGRSLTEAANWDLRMIFSDYY